MALLVTWVMLDMLVSSTHSRTKVTYVQTKNAKEGKPNQEIDSCLLASHLGDV